MSQTRILCHVCRFPVAYCKCKRVRADEKAKPPVEVDLSKPIAELNQSYLDYMHDWLSSAAVTPPPQEVYKVEVKHDNPWPGWTSIIGPDGQPSTMIRTIELFDLLKEDEDEPTKH